MKVSRIQPNINFKNTAIKQDNSQKPEVIDKLLGVVQNQSDVNDCVAVPRGIFKAYIWIMSGAGLLGIAGVLPAKFKNTKSALSILGNIMYIISAFYFAKPFAFKGVSPTVNMKETNTRNN